MPSKNNKETEGNRNRSNNGQEGMRQFSNGLLELESDTSFGEYP